MNERQTYLSMIRQMPGGMDAMSAALGLTRSALENRIYERRGQSVSVDQALQMAEFVQSTLFAQFVAERTGGVFISLPEGDVDDRDELLNQWNEVYAELGELSRTFQASILDGEVDPRERQRLVDVAQAVHVALKKLMELTFTVYCRHGEDER